MRNYAQAGPRRKHLTLTRNAAAAILISWAGTACGQETLSGEGGPLSFDLGYGVIVNEGSTLRQTWMVVNDPSMPVSFEVAGYTGLTTSYVERGYRHEAAITLNVAQPIAAVRVVVLPYDVWNRPNRPLALERISDVAAGTLKLEGAWDVYSETEALGVLTTITYIDQVRLADGTIMVSDYDYVLEQARKLSAGLELTDIKATEPKKE